MTGRNTLAEAFRSSANGLNGMRILLALTVIATHSYDLTGRPIPSDLAWVMTHSYIVDGFFAISGFLIMRSWSQRPQVGTYVRSRVARLFPGYWLNLLLTAFVIGPLAVVGSGAALPEGYWQAGGEWVAGRSLFRAVGVGFGIAGTPEGVPYPAVWNGSLWTLQWEVYCYIAVLVLGVLGLFRWRHTTGALLLVMVVVEAAVIASGWNQPATRILPDGSGLQFMTVTFARLGLAFTVGMVFWVFRERIPVRGYLVVASVAVLPVAALTNYIHVIADLPLAYLMIVGSSLIRRGPMTTKNDLSYGTYIYSFPIQQALILLTGAESLHPLVFAALTAAVTVPVAALSWVCVERPILRWARGSAGMTHSEGEVRVPTVGAVPGAATVDT